MATPDPEADPGWHPAVRWIVLPFWLRSGDLEPRDALVACRTNWLGVFLAVMVASPLGVLGISITEHTPRSTGVAVPIFSALSICLALGTLIALPRLVPLDTRSGELLRASYVTRCRWRLAAVFSPALTGFSLATVAGPWWVFFIAQAFSLLGLGAIAPTARRVETDQRALWASGSPLSLRAALRPSVLPD